MKFTPTTARGRELRQLVLERIEREVEKAGKGPDSTCAGVWDQQRWADMDLDKLKKFGIIPDYRTAVPIPPEAAAECGTSFCFAGHALVMAGDRLVAEPTIPSRGSMAVVIFAETFDSNEMIDIRLRGAQLLELTNGQADVLFDEANTLTDIREILARIDDGEVSFWCNSCDEYGWQCECDYRYSEES